MPLTDIAVRHAKPEQKPRKLVDGKGLYLLVMPTGARYWRWKYRHGGKEKVMALGVYPDVTLAQARERHHEERRLLATGADPMAKRKQEALAPVALTFKGVSERWFLHWSPAVSKAHSERVWSALEKEVFPDLGARSANALNASAFRDVAKRIDARNSPIAARVILQAANQIMRYAVAHDLAERNPVADFRSSDVLKAHKKKNHPRVAAKDLPALLFAIEQYSGAAATWCALQLLAQTFVRARELTDARWSEFDLDEARWDIPAERMKMKTPHIVPLSRQALAVLEKMKAITGDGEYVFGTDSKAKRPIHRNTLLYAIHRLGYKGRMTSHGFRGVASTILHEQGWPHEHIELQLAHQERGVSAAYNHATHVQGRSTMMQAWADYLDKRRAEYQPPE